MLQKSLTLLPHVKAANASENLVHLVKFDKLCIHCMKQIKFSKNKKQTTIYSNQHRDEYDIHKFRKQLHFWCVLSSA